MVLIGRDPEKFDLKYAELLSADDRDKLRAGLGEIRAALLGDAAISVIQLVVGNEDAVGARVQERVLEINDGFIQRYYSNVLGRLMSLDSIPSGLTNG